MTEPQVESRDKVIWPMPVSMPPSHRRMLDDIRDMAAKIVPPAAPERKRFEPEPAYTIPADLPDWRRDPRVVEYLKERAALLSRFETAKAKATTHERELASARDRLARASSFDSGKALDPAELVDAHAELGRLEAATAQIQAELYSASQGAATLGASGEAITKAAQDTALEAWREKRRKLLERRMKALKEVIELEEENVRLEKALHSMFPGQSRETGIYFRPKDAGLRLTKWLDRLLTAANYAEWMHWVKEAL